MFNWLLTHTPLLYLTQSLWRDEVFSIFVAQRPLSFIISHLGFEPPVYYILLHYWIKLFGTSEVATRSLSFVGFSLATILVIIWAEKLFPRHFLSWFLPLFFFLNPMLLYYAFEVRTYGWYIFFSVASLYTFLTKQWGWYIVSSVLGFYTHSYFLVLIGTQGLYWALTEKFKQKDLTQNHAFRSFLAIGLFIAPWLVKIFKEAGRLKDSWYFPVNMQLVKSALGNMFLGYEGTPWWGWGFTAWLSLILLALFAIALKPKETRQRNVLFFLVATLPLALTIGISFLKPLYVNRYLIPVTVAEVFLVVFALEAITKKHMQYLSLLCSLLFVFGFNLWYPQYHRKVPFRDSLGEITRMMRNSDVIFAESSLSFFESVYYSRDPSRVYLYTPHGAPFPWYVGDAVFSKKQSARDLPVYPARAFLIKEDGSFEIAYLLSKAP